MNTSLHTVRALLVSSSEAQTQRISALLTRARIVPFDHADSARQALEQSGVLVLPSDAPESLIVQTIRLLAAVRIQLEQMQHKTEKLEAKVADIRIINRAKLLLVQHLQMTETEAHKYIEKQAMDTSMRRRTIAENIIRTYED